MKRKRLLYRRLKAYLLISTTSQSTFYGFSMEDVKAQIAAKGINLSTTQIKLKR